MTVVMSKQLVAEGFMRAAAKMLAGE